MKRMNPFMKHISISALCLSLLLTGCGGSTGKQTASVFRNSSETEAVSEKTDDNKETTPAETETQVQTESETETEPPEITETVTLIAAGDNLIHNSVYTHAYNRSKKTYDFAPMYDDIKDEISSRDIAVINQETIFVADESNVSSYPAFGTPQVMGDALVDVGFDVILNATNHTYDKRMTGLEDTLAFWKKYPEITILGIHETQEDADTVDVVEKNGIRMAMFNYTYAQNGDRVPEKSYMIDMLSNNKKKLLSDLRDVEDEVDISICFIHIGREYVYEPTDSQVETINEMIDAGADLVICAHPHVVEPYKEVVTEAGNSAIVFYSCGNLISGQDEIPRLLGGLADVTIKKTSKGDESSTIVSSCDFIPVVTHYTSSESKVYLLEHYTDSLAKKHSIRRHDSRFSVDYLWDLWCDITGEEIP